MKSNTSEFSSKYVEEPKGRPWGQKGRGNAFNDFVPLAPENEFEAGSESVFVTCSAGMCSGRGAWSYNYSKSTLRKNIRSMLDFYNLQVFNAKPKNDPRKISWTYGLMEEWKNGRLIEYEESRTTLALYRPFQKQWLYHGEGLIEKRSGFDFIFPEPDTKNLVICVSGVGAARDFSCLISDRIVDAGCMGGDTPCFPLYWRVADGRRCDGVSDWILHRAREKYGTSAPKAIINSPRPKDMHWGHIPPQYPPAPSPFRRKRGPLSKDDVFYYVYAILHLPEYRDVFAGDLKKSLPRIPLVDRVEDFWAFSRAGRELVELHTTYEDKKYIQISSSCKETTDGWWVHSDSFFVDYDYGCGSVEMHYHGYKDQPCDRVEKMCFSHRNKGEELRYPSWDAIEDFDGAGRSLKPSKSTIIFNENITITSIPSNAYRHTVNGKSAIEWVMEQYQIKTDKDSGITNDPNHYAEELGDPNYILHLLLSVITVSAKTMEIVEGLPSLGL